MQLLRIILFYFTCVHLCIFECLLCLYIKWIAYCGSRSKVWKPLVKNSSNLHTTCHLSVTLQKHFDYINWSNFSVIFYDSGYGWIKEGIGDKCLVLSANTGLWQDSNPESIDLWVVLLVAALMLLTKMVADPGIWDQPPDSQYYTSLSRFTATSPVSQIPILSRIYRCVSHG